MSQRRKRWIGVVITLLSLMAISLPVARKHAERLAVDPDKAPPQVQISNQTRKLLQQRSKIVIPDAEIGFRLPPGLDQHVETDDFEFRRQTDSRGFPNRGGWPEKADIVFLGDSLIAGEGVGVDGAFVTLVGDELPGVAAVNLAMPGAGLERQYRILRRYGIGLKPALVVACFYVASDLTNDSQFLQWLDDSKGKDYNAYRLSYSRRSDDRPRSSLIRRLQGHVYYDLVLSIIEPNLWGDRRIIHRKDMPDGTEILFNRKMVRFASEKFSGSEPEFDNFRATLDRLQAEVDSIGAGLVFVMMPSKEELFAVESGGGRGNAAKIIRDELGKREIPFLDLYPVLENEAQSAAVFYPRDAHLNRFGNEIVADAFVAWLRNSGILQPLPRNPSRNVFETSGIAK